MTDITLSTLQDRGSADIAEWYRNCIPNEVGQKFYLGGYAGTGKRQPLFCTIQTPEGPRLMGDLKVGDIISHPFDGTSTVEYISPKVLSAYYKVTFRDGTFTYSDIEHLWTVQTRKMKNTSGNYLTLTLKEIVERGVTYNSGDYKFAVPLSGAIDYSAKLLPIHPYVLGVLLGDGELGGSSVTVSKGGKDREIFERIATLLPEEIVPRKSCFQGDTQRLHLIVPKALREDNPLLNELGKLGLRVSGSKKFIPELYLQGSISQRLDLLKGLMDTDGSAKNNRITFHTCNEQLGRDVCRLVRSLGGVAISNRCERSDGKSTEWAINVKMNVCSFFLKRKAEQWWVSSKNPPSKYIKSVEYVGETEQQCIKVSNSDGLYLTDDFIVTHNTSVIPAIIDRCGLDFKDVAFCAPTGKAAKVITGKLRGMYNTSDIKAKTIHSSIYIPARAKVEALREEVKALEENLGAFQMRAVEFMNDMDAFKQRCAEMEAKLEDKKDEFDAANRAYRRAGPSFVLNTDAPIRDCKLIVVDEASMVGEEIAADLMEFGVPVLAIGDPAQLPPVGDKPGLAVGRPDFFLDEIHRQARDNPIIQLSMDIREGKSIRPGKMGDKVTIVSRHKDEWTLNPDYDAQVICGTHKRRWGLTSKIRKMCGYTSSAPMVDEPLLVCKNSKKYENLVNGSFVTCDMSPGELTEGHASFEVTITDELGDQYSMDVYQGTFEEHKAREKDFYSAPQFEAFDAKRKAEMLDWAWVITAHKSQGSQYENVIVHDESGVFGKDATKWLYTSCTRAIEELVIVL